MLVSTLVILDLQISQQSKDGHRLMDNSKLKSTDSAFLIFAAIATFTVKK